MNVLRDTNRYFTMMEPWTIRKRVKNAIKNGGNGAEMDVKRADTIVYNTLEVLRICSLLLQPIVPKISENILTFLNEDERGVLNIDNEGLWREGNIEFNGVYGKAFKIIDKERQQ